MVGPVMLIPMPVLGVLVEGTVWTLVEHQRPAHDFPMAKCCSRGLVTI